MVKGKEDDVKECGQEPFGVAETKSKLFLQWMKKQNPRGHDLPGVMVPGALNSQPTAFLPEPHCLLPSKCSL